MTAPHHPGSVFENLYPIRKDLKTGRTLFTEKSPLKMEFFTLEFEWLKQACHEVRKEGRSVSFSEFEDIRNQEKYFTQIHRILIEMISDGKYCFLFVNTCPIAQIDTKSDKGLAEYFDYPPMTREEWEMWELLGASTIHFEVFRSGEDLFMEQIKKEEGIVNALRMGRRVNLRDGKSSLWVNTDHCALPAKPTMENLEDWIGVRSGRADAQVLKWLG